jgi:uncharacterized membrane protein YedE/YeeE
MFESIVMAIFGGILIGLSASGMMYFVGRVAGISGICAGILSPKKGDTDWRIAFVGGLLLGGILLFVLWPSSIQVPINRSFPAVSVAGLLVGLGVRLGNGCTSGHGVCGLSRFSLRSLIATLSFMGIGMIIASTIQYTMEGVL